MLSVLTFLYVRNYLCMVKGWEPEATAYLLNYLTLLNFLYGGMHHNVLFAGLTVHRDELISSLLVNIQQDVFVGEPTT